MRKTILMMLLALVSGSAVADWVQVAEDESRAVYIDPATFRWDKKRNNVNLWVLQDEKKTIESGMLSVKALYEFDCKAEQVRILFSIAHAGHMGKGDVLLSETDPFNWQPAVPRSIGAFLWKIACKKN